MCKKYTCSGSIMTCEALNDNELNVDNVVEGQKGVRCKNDTRSGSIEMCKD